VRNRWIALDAKRRRIPLLLTVPILGAAMLLGPIGLGFYLVGVLPWFYSMPCPDIAPCTVCTV
jgi:hypothetical protein